MSIELNRESVSAEAYAYGEQHTWPLRVTAVSTEDGLPSEIFIWHRNAADVINPEPDPFKGDRCDAVASVHQLSTTQADNPEEPSGDYQAPYYRADVGVWHCTSLTQADSLWDKIQADVTDLLENFRAAANLELDETVNIVSPLTL